MPRIRSVHPDICTSETMAGLSAELERTFVRLWTHCDDSGRAIDNPRLLKAALFPLHDDICAATVQEHLEALERVGLLQRYVVDGQRLLAIRSWTEFQHPKHPVKSKLPEPPAPSPVQASPNPGNNAAPNGGARAPVVPKTAQGVVVGEGVGEGGGEGVLAPIPARNKRDAIWDAMLHVCGISGAITPPARGAYNKARADLAACDATPETIRQRATVFRMRWPGVSLTPTALARRWSECEPNAAHMPVPKLSPAEAALARHAMERP